MSAPNYPPGVTDADIERHFGTDGPRRCGECRHWMPECGGQCELALDEAEAMGGIPLGIREVARWLEDSSIAEDAEACGSFEEAR